MKSYLQDRCSECGRKKPAPRKATDKAKDTRARVRARKAERREKRRSRTARVHWKVMARQGPDCELGEHGWPRDSIEMHHLKAGSAKAFTESVRNCVRSCRHHHDDFHFSGAEKYREVVTRLCRRFRYRLPSVYRREPRAQRAPKAVSGGS